MNDPQSLGLQTFNPTNYGQLAAGAIFYILVLISLFFSLITIYSLIKYGKSRGLGFVVSVIYLIIYLALISSGTTILTNIK